MQDQPRLQDFRIAVVGLGLMGGSLALALKGKCAALYGIDSNAATLDLALEKKVVEQGDTDLTRLLPRADLLVLATPVPAILGLLAQLPSLMENRCIVLDLGSTKGDITRLMASLPPRFDPIGGHPICGKENLGLENADACLYQGAPFVLAPLQRTTPRARRLVNDMVCAIGARPLEIGPEQHDRALAFTSHLPFLLSSALSASLPPGFEDLIGSGFRSTARLAGTPSYMMLGVLQSNRENVLSALHEFQQELAALEAALSAREDVSLASLLDSARARYQSITR